MERTHIAKIAQRVELQRFRHCAIQQTPDDTLSAFDVQSRSYVPVNYRYYGKPTSHTVGLESISLRVYRITPGVSPIEATKVDRRATQPCFSGHRMYVISNRPSEDSANEAPYCSNTNQRSCHEPRAVLFFPPMRTSIKSSYSPSWCIQFESLRIEKRLEAGNVFGHTDRSEKRFTRRRRTEGRQTRVTGNIDAIIGKTLAKENNPNIVATTTLILSGIVDTSPTVLRHDENQYGYGHKALTAMRIERPMSDPRDNVRSRLHERPTELERTKENRKNS